MQEDVRDTINGSTGIQLDASMGASSDADLINLDIDQGHEEKVCLAIFYAILKRFIVVLLFNCI